MITRKKLSCSYRSLKDDRFIHTAQMYILLRKGDLDFRFPESTINLLVKLADYRHPFFSIRHPDAQLEVECTLPETQI